MDIICQNVSKEYDNNKMALNNFSMELNYGEIIVLMGRSGIGKTTLFNILMNTIKPSNGVILGLDNKKISAVFQEDRLLENLSAIDNVSVINGISKEESKAALIMVLNEEFLRLPVSKLSGGMKRRVAIVRAIEATSDIVIMDEPFGSIDEENKSNIAKYILKKLDGRTLMVSTHNEDDIELLGGRKVVVQAKE